MFKLYVHNIIQHESGQSKYSQYLTYIYLDDAHVCAHIIAVPDVTNKINMKYKPIILYNSFYPFFK